jgi:hypothetical protein
MKKILVLVMAVLWLSFMLWGLLMMKEHNVIHEEIDLQEEEMRPQYREWDSQDNVILLEGLATILDRLDTIDIHKNYEEDIVCLTKSIVGLQNQLGVNLNYMVYQNDMIKYSFKSIGSNLVGEHTIDYMIWNCGSDWDYETIKEVPITKDFTRDEVLYMLDYLFDNIVDDYTYDTNSFILCEVEDGEQTECGSLYTILTTLEKHKEG